MKTGGEAREPVARKKLLEAAVKLVRARGFAATTIDALCAEAGVAKGSFFHHFENKDALAVAAARYWSETTSELFALASYHEPENPLDRLLAYLDFRKALLIGTPAEFSCLVGTMTQEVFATHPAIRDACAHSIVSHALTLEADIAEAMQRYGVRADWSARSLALHTQAVLQGAFVLAKTQDGAALAADSIDHLKRYVEGLFRGLLRPASGSFMASGAFVGG
jgi:TetR/AcrR family transcriptional repressor of nem operon